jgi:hypothetical protein
MVGRSIWGFLLLAALLCASPEARAQNDCSAEYSLRIAEAKRAYARSDRVTGDFFKEGLLKACQIIWNSIDAAQGLKQLFDSQCRDFLIKNHPEDTASTLDHLVRLQGVARITCPKR